MRKFLSFPLDFFIFIGFNVRLSGQDVARGTFSQRHFGIFDQNTGNVFYPFKNLGDAAGKFSTVNSLLSEFAVMGFEYGYSIDDPKNLVYGFGEFLFFLHFLLVLSGVFFSLFGKGKSLSISVFFFSPTPSLSQTVGSSIRRL